MVTKASVKHAKEISDIYNFSIANDPYANCNAKPLEISYWEEKIEDPRSIVLVRKDEDGSLLGFSVVQPFTVRKQYQNVFELSIYVKSKSRGKGLSAELYFTTIKYLPNKEDIYLLALVFDENVQSIRLLKIGGFKTLFKLKEAAYKEGGFSDMVLLVNDFVNVPTEFDVNRILSSMKA